MSQDEDRYHLLKHGESSLLPKLGKGSAESSWPSSETEHEGRHSQVLTLRDFKWTQVSNPCRTASTPFFHLLSGVIWHYWCLPCNLTWCEICWGGLRSSPSWPCHHNTGSPTVYPHMDSPKLHRWKVSRGNDLDKRLSGILGCQLSLWA